jgi:hypothetical protein
MTAPNWYPTTAGIYSITNTVTGRVYIGSTMKFCTRWTAHRTSLRGDRHPNRQLQADWNRYGEQAFTFEIVEVVENFSLLLSKEKEWAAHHEDHLYDRKRDFMHTLEVFTDRLRRHAERFSDDELNQIGIALRAAAGLVEVVLTERDRED